MQSDHWHLGRTSTLQLIFTHRLPRTLSIQIAAAVPASFDTQPIIYCIDVARGQRTRLSVDVTAVRLGVHAWPALESRIGGALGLAWWRKRLQPEYVATVVPDLLQSADCRSTAIAGVGHLIQQRLGAGSEIRQLREYRSGDPPRAVDWKATARAGKTISRDFSEDQHLEIIIAIDAGRASGLRSGSLDRLGHYANVAARLAQYAVSQDDRVGLVIFADRPLVTLAPARGTLAVRRIRERISCTEVQAAESNPLQAAVQVRSLIRHRALIVILTDFDDATVASQLAAAAKLLLPRHLPLIAGLASSAAESLCHAAARDWVEPYARLAAQEYCLRLERNAQALRALGAPTVLARPERLERAVFEEYQRFRLRKRV